MHALKSPKWLAVVGIVAVAAAGYGYLNRSSTSAPGGAAISAPGGSPRAVGVEMAKVQVQRLQDDAVAVGSLKSNQGVMLRPEVAGRVSAILFRDGAPVNRGQILMQLDDVLPQAELKQAQAQVSVATSSHKRNQDLVAQKFIAQSKLDESAAALQVAEAQLALAQARVARMKVVAPFAGAVGIRNVNVGDYVKDGADLVSIEDLSTMQVDFRLPERFQSSVKVGQAVDVAVDALPGRVFKARITALDPLLDANGRSVAVRASLPNNAGMALSPSATPLDAQAKPLRPGMFARVTVVFGVKEQALSVPEEAIVPQGGRQFVIQAVPAATLSDDQRKGLPEGTTLVSKRVEVQLGIRRPGRVEIVRGLALGDSVVVAGQQKLQKDGTALRPVELNPAAKPAATASAPSSAPAPAAATTTSAPAPSPR